MKCVYCNSKPTKIFKFYKLTICICYECYKECILVLEDLKIPFDDHIRVEPISLYVKFVDDIYCGQKYFNIKNTIIENLKPHVIKEYIIKLFTGVNVYDSYNFDSYFIEECEKYNLFDRRIFTIYQFLDDLYLYGGIYGYDYFVEILRREFNNILYYDYAKQHRFFRYIIPKITKIFKRYSHLFLLGYPEKCSYEKWEKIVNLIKNTLINYEKGKCSKKYVSDMIYELLLPNLSSLWW